MTAAVLIMGSGEQEPDLRIDLNPEQIYTGFLLRKNQITSYFIMPSAGFKC
jgi:hypothetical protein